MNTTYEKPSTLVEGFFIVQNKQQSIFFFFKKWDEYIWPYIGFLWFIGKSLCFSFLAEEVKNNISL